ncbi:hypothetical protein ACFQ3Z_24750 [Streptomyces nogalater]
MNSSTRRDSRENFTGLSGCSVPSVNITFRKVPPRSTLDRIACSRSASVAIMYTGAGNSTPWPVRPAAFVVAVTA